MAWLGGIWRYPARPITVIDGDTIKVLRDGGEHITREMTVRLANIDTPEARGGSKLSKQWAGEATQFTRNWLDEAASMDHEWPLEITSHKAPKTGHPRKSFTRYVLDVQRYDGLDLGDCLIAAGYARAVRDRIKLKQITAGIWFKDATKAHLVIAYDETASVITTPHGNRSRNVQFHIVAPNALMQTGVEALCTDCVAYSAFSSDLWHQLWQKNEPLKFGEQDEPVNARAIGPKLAQRIELESDHGPSQPPTHYRDND